MCLCLRKTEKNHRIGYSLDGILALLLYKYLEARVNECGNHFSPKEIVRTLSGMNFLPVAGEGYVPDYTRTDLTDALHASSGFRTDREIVTKKAMREIISFTRNSRSSRQKRKEQ